MELDELTPARVLLLRYMIDSQLTAPGSISGHQADRLRSGLGGAPQDGGRVAAPPEAGRPISRRTA